MDVRAERAGSEPDRPGRRIDPDRRERLGADIVHHDERAAPRQFARLGQGLTDEQPVGGVGEDEATRRKVAVDGVIEPELDIVGGSFEDFDASGRVGAQADHVALFEKGGQRVRQHGGLGMAARFKPPSARMAGSGTRKARSRGP